MTDSLHFVIRDGLETDIDRCIELDHRYKTEHVWQMRFQEDKDHWQTAFNSERLPRMIEVEYVANEKRIKRALHPEHAFLVVTRTDDEEILAYMTIYSDRVYNNGHLQDIVVNRPYRRRYIGTRLLQVAHQWAWEQGLERLILELRTKNYPGIQFGQARGFRFCGFNDHYHPNQDITLFFAQSIH